jgi:chromosomal replication initiation ATPase DnaA
MATKIEILNAICEKYEVTAAFMFDSRRDRKRVELRQLFFALCRDINYNESLVSISVFIYGYSEHFFDHATILHGIKKIQDRLAVYGDFRRDYNGLRDQIKGNNFPKIVVTDVNLLQMCSKTF